MGEFLLRCGVLGESLLTRGIGRLKWIDWKSAMSVVVVVGFLRTWHRGRWRIWRLEQEPPPRGCILGVVLRDTWIGKVLAGMREKSTYLPLGQGEAVGNDLPAIEKQRDWTCFLCLVVVMW